MTPLLNMGQKPLLPSVMAFAAAFLGLLHLEIIQERLEREFDLDLITTAPSGAFTKFIYAPP